MTDTTAALALEVILHAWGPGGLLCWNEADRITLVSHGFVPLLRLSEAPAVGASIACLWEWLGHRCEADPVELRLALTTRNHLDLHLREEDSSVERRLRLSLHRLAEPDVGYLLLVRDVTDRLRTEVRHRATELALGETAQRLSSLFHAAPIGIGVVRARVFQQVNPRLCDMLGYGEDDLVGQDARMLYFSDEEYDRVGREKYAMLRDRGIGEVETCFRRRDGSPMEVWLRSAWLDPRREDAGVTLMILDITERKRQEEAWRDSEQRARALLDAMPDLMFRFDRAGVFLDYKARREDLADQRVGGLIGCQIRDTAPRAFADLVEAKIAATLASQELQEFEYSLEVPGRGLRDWEARMVCSGTDEVIATVRDITDRKAAAARLHTLSRVVEQSQDAILLTDVEFRITYLNPAFQRLFGWSLEDLRGQTPDLLNAEPDPGAHQAALYRRLAAGEEVLSEAINRRRDGLLFHCQYWISPLRDEGGELIGYMGSQRDVTERKFAEMALVESETRYRTLYEQVPQGVVLYDREGRVLDANPAALSILGCRSEEVLGQRPDAARWRCIREDGSPFPEEDYPIYEALRTGSPVRNVVIGLFNRVRQDIVWINIDAVPLCDWTGDPRPTGVFASFADVTDARRLRQALVQTQKMEAIGRLTSGVAHDFNNILGSVLGFADLARQRHAGADSKLDGYLEQIDIACTRARDLVRQLLIFSRGDSTGRAKPLALTPVIREVLGLLRPILPANLEIRFDAPEVLGLVRIDPVHLQQILMNLALNARDAMPEGGTLTVTLCRCQVSDEECRICAARVSGDWFEILVADTGNGIPEEHLDLLFQPFFTTKEAGAGTGMGLAVVAGLMRTYEGHVLVRSRPGQGSAFHLLLHPEPSSTTVDLDMTDPVA